MGAANLAWIGAVGNIGDVAALGRKRRARSGRSGLSRGGNLGIDYLVGSTTIAVTTFWPPSSSKLALTVAPGLRSIRWTFTSDGIMRTVPSARVSLAPLTLTILPSTR